MRNGTVMFGKSMTSGSGKIGIVAGNVVAGGGVRAAGDCIARNPALDSARTRAEVGPGIARFHVHHATNTRIAILKELCAGRGMLYKKPLTLTSTTFFGSHACAKSS